MRRILRFIYEEDGPTAVEYAVMLALVIGLCLTGITTLGQQTHSSLDDSKTKLETAISSS